LLRHVTLRGKIGPIKINKVAHFQDRNRNVVATADPKQPEHYENVDWALDISQAQCVDLSIEGIPARKIIRDPATQVVVTRRLAKKGGWRKKVSDWNSYWPYVIDYHLDDGEDDMVLVAPKGNKKAKFKKLLDGIKELCDLGVAVREYP
jgi:hypothetical protein